MSDKVSGKWVAAGIAIGIILVVALLIIVSSKPTSIPSVNGDDVADAGPFIFYRGQVFEYGDIGLSQSDVRTATGASDNLWDEYEYLGYFKLAHIHERSYGDVSTTLVMNGVGSEKVYLFGIEFQIRCEHSRIVLTRVIE